MTVHETGFTQDELDYGVCGCNMCGVGIYDGIIVWVLKDGTKVNRFRGEGSHREQRVQDFIASALTPEKPHPMDGPHD